MRIIKSPMSEMNVAVTAKAGATKRLASSFESNPSIDAVATPVTPKPRVVVERNGAVLSKWVLLLCLLSSIRSTHLGAACEEKKREKNRNRNIKSSCQFHVLILPNLFSLFPLPKSSLFPTYTHSNIS